MTTSAAPRLGAQARLGYADPDGTRLRLYTLEQHGAEIPAAVDEPWVAVIRPPDGPES